MRRFVTAIAILLTACVGLGCADVPDPSHFRRWPIPERPVELEVAASMKVEPAKGQKNMLRLELTLTGAGRYEYAVKEEAGGLEVCSGGGVCDGKNTKTVEDLFPHREISGDEEVRYIAEATFTPLNGGAVRTIRQVLAVCLINGAVEVLEELEAPEIL